MVAQNTWAEPYILILKVIFNMFQVTKSILFITNKYLSLLLIVLIIYFIVLCLYFLKYI